MSTTSRKRTSTAEEMGPVLFGLMTLVLFLVAFPAWLLGFFASRALQRYLLSWRGRLSIWLVLTFLSCYTLYSLYSHGLENLLLREFTAYILTIKHVQADFLHWPWGWLWSLTWPVWLRTLVAIPIVAFFCEGPGLRPGQTARELRLRSRRRQRRIVSSQRRARKRSTRPGRLPDQIGEMMVIGAVINDHDHDDEG